MWLTFVRICRSTAMKPLSLTIDAGLFCADPLAVRLPADGHQNQIVALRLLGRRFARERYMDAIRFRIDCDRLSSSA